MEQKIMYIIYHPNGGYWTNTLSFYRKDAIKKHLDSSDITWKESRKYGWEVRKVEVTINPI